MSCFARRLRDDSRKARNMFTKYSLPRISYISFDYQQKKVFAKKGYSHEKYVVQHIKKIWSC